MVPKEDIGVHFDITLANDIYDVFCQQTNSLKTILNLFNHLCEVIHVRPSEIQYFYPKIKSRLTSWKAEQLWSKFDKRLHHKVYENGKLCSGQRVLVIGAGPCGLRTAIEAQLLGAKVVVIEKRDRFSRNNVLHLWPYNIHDLKSLGAKQFYGKFCAGSIDHISINQLQCILLKICLLLGVEVHENVSFEGLVEPNEEEACWRAEVSPSGHPTSHYEFNILIGADGKRNTLDGFQRTELRGKLAIAITANFVRNYDDAESKVEEISGVSFIFNQEFFTTLNHAKGIDLENIVYYKDNTHYFVMTAKKKSLLDKGVLLENFPETTKLLSAENIDMGKLLEYAKEAALYATKNQLPNLSFAFNHHGNPDVAMFDFTSMFQAKNSCRLVVRRGQSLLISLVGDSLLEPFWPTGTGCARGFFGGLDACWLMKQLTSGQMTVLEALAERESIYRILAQTKPENTSKDYSGYTVDPSTRYTNLNSKAIPPSEVEYLVDTDNPQMIKEELSTIKSSQIFGQERTASPDALQKWFKTQLEAYEGVEITSLTTSFQNGLALCAITHKYRPDLIDFGLLNENDSRKNISLALKVLHREVGIRPLISADQWNSPEGKNQTLNYLYCVYKAFRGEIPGVKMILSEDCRKLLHSLDQKRLSRASVGSAKHKSNLEDVETKPKRRRPSKIHKESEENRHSNYKPGEIKSIKDGARYKAIVAKLEDQKVEDLKSDVKTEHPNTFCSGCSVCVPKGCGIEVEGKVFHFKCFRCHHCNTFLNPWGYSYHLGGKFAGKFFCPEHSTNEGLKKFDERCKSDDIRVEETRLWKQNDCESSSNSEKDYSSTSSLETPNSESETTDESSEDEESTSETNSSIMSREFRVFTLNCYAIAYAPILSSPFRKQRIDAIMDHIEKSNYDIVCLQEVWTEGDQERIKNHCKSTFPFATSFFGGLIGTGTMIMSRWVIEETGYFQFSLNGYFHHLHYGDALAGSGIGLVKVRTPDNILVNVYVSHFHAEYNRVNDAYLVDRSLQAFEAGNFIRQTRQGSDVVMFCGDFNTERGDLPHRILTKVYDLKDSHPKEALLTHYVKSNSFTAASESREISIDYIMHQPVNSKKWRTETVSLEKPLEMRIPGLETSYSDHEALVGKILVERLESNEPVEKQGSSQSANVLYELSEKISKEVFYNGLWQLLHLGMFVLILGLRFCGEHCWNSFLATIFSYFSGLLMMANIFQVLFYQKRRYTLRQLLQEINTKQSKSANKIQNN